jgi:hypothetical protein
MGSKHMEEKKIMNRRKVSALALATVLLTATGAYADYTSGGDSQAPRGHDGGSPRVDDHTTTDVQAPRG